MNASELDRRDPNRDTGYFVAQGKNIYLTQRRKGFKHSRAVNAVLAHFRKVSIPIKDRRTINAWAKRYNWEDDL